MSYLTNSSRSHRPGAVVAVVAIHAVVGYALVTGLSYSAFKTIREYAPIFEFKDPPPPPPPDPVIQPDVPTQPPVTAPAPVIDLTPQRPQIDVVIADQVPLPLPLSIPRVEPLIQPKPQPSFAARAARPRNDAAGWVRTEDYPAASLRLDEEGTTGFAVIVGSDGKVDACEITKSSGSARLDEATCRNVERRARFEPAIDDTGTKVVGRYTSTVRWQIPR